MVKRRDFLEVTAAAMAAPMMNRGRFTIWAGKQDQYSALSSKGRAAREVVLRPD